MKHRQAKEIRELRRKLRESILVLPPSVYRAAKSSLPAEETPGDEEEEEEEDEDDDEQQAIVEGKTDEAYMRVRTMIEALLASGRKALETRPEDFYDPGEGRTKVLSEEEARTWRGEDSSTIDREEVDDGTTDDDPSRPLSPSQTTDQLDDLASEDEVEASLVLDHGVLNGSSLPPITVTPSPSP